MDLFYPEGMNVAGELEVHPALLGKSFMVLVDKQAVENWLLHVVMDRGISCALARILVSGQSANQVVQIDRQKSGGS